MIFFLVFLIGVILGSAFTVGFIYAQVEKLDESRDDS